MTTFRQVSLSTADQRPKQAWIWKARTCLLPDPPTHFNRCTKPISGWPLYQPVLDLQTNSDIRFRCITKSSCLLIAPLVAVRRGNATSWHLCRTSRTSCLAAWGGRLVLDTRVGKCAAEIPIEEYSSVLRPSWSYSASRELLLEKSFRVTSFESISPFDCDRRRGILNFEELQLR